ncbi:hypothetical protein ACFVVX_01455 [Kitasatospora sp. NPDC058170]|uniref:hypothetical protein n=1 Tax=Kitasatospora sp. NPDC058170 TaxID=3346364 RepID=UPI0036D950A6
MPLHRSERAGRRGGTSLGAGLLAVLALVSGCAAATPAAPPIAAPPTRPVAPPTAGTNVADLHLPIEQYMLTPLQSVQFDWVRKAAIGSCMKRYGLDYPAGAKPGPDSPGVRTFTPMNRRYGITEADGAARWGYHLPQAAPAAPAPDQPVTPVAPAALAALPTAAQTVLLGVDPGNGARVTAYQGKPLPEGGCFAELDRVLPGAVGGPQGPGNGPQGVVTDIKSASFTGSRSAPEVVAATAAWADCMKGRGFDIPDPLNAPATVTTMRDPAPGGAEIAQAVADVECKGRTNLTGIWFAAESTLQNAAIAAHAKDLAAVKATLDSEAGSLGRLLDHDWSSPVPATP